MAFLSDEEYENLIKSLNAKPSDFVVKKKEEVDSLTRTSTFKWNQKPDTIVDDAIPPKLADTYTKALAKVIENMLMGSMTNPPSDYYDMGSHSVKIPLTKPENPVNVEFKPEAYMDPKILTLK